MNREPGDHNRMRWFQYSLGFLLLVMTSVAVIMSLFLEPIGPDGGGKARVPPELTEPEKALDAAIQDIHLHWPKDSAEIVSWNEQWAEDEKAARTHVEATDKCRPPLGVDQPGNHAPHPAADPEQLP
jgi:hypothetical protein